MSANYSGANQNLHRCEIAKRMLKSLAHQMQAFALLLVSSSCLLGCVAGDLTDHRLVAFDLSPNDRQIVFSSAKGDLFLLDLSSGKVKQLTATPNAETDPAYSPDGSSIVYTSLAQDGTEAHIYRLNLQDKSSMELTSGRNIYDRYPSICDDHSQIVFARAHRYRTYSMGGMTWDDWDIYTMNIDGSDLSRVTSQSYRRIRKPQFDIGGSRIIFSANTNRDGSSIYSTVFKVSASGEHPPVDLVLAGERNMESNAIGLDPALSHDGKKIVFVSDRKTRYNYDLYVMNSDGTNPNALDKMDVSKYNSSPVFSHNRESIYFLAEARKNANSQPLFSLWKADSTGKNPCLVADEKLFNDPVQWVRCRAKENEKQ